MTHNRPFAGPRGWRCFLTDHARERWAERLALPPAELVHAVRFSRVFATQGAEYVALWYAPDEAVFVCKRTGPLVFVLTCFHRLEAGGRLKGALHRHMTGAAQPQGVSGG